MRPLVSLIVAGLLAADAVTAPGAWAAGRAAPPATQTVSGDVVVYGCQVTPADIMVTALEPQTIQAWDANGQAVPPPNALTANQPQRARVFQTSDPHRFTLQFPNLGVDHAYSIAASLNRQKCPSSVWRDPNNGWLTPGVTQSMHLEAYEMRTQVEVLGAHGPNHTPTWVGVDAVNFKDPNGAVRQLRWRTDVPGVVGGVVQVAAQRFPVGAAAQQTQVPLLASWQVPAAQTPGGWSTLPSTDFSTLIGGPCPQNGCQPQQPSAADALRKEIQNGLPVYIRVVPVDANNNPITDGLDTGISSWVRIASVPNVDGSIPPPPPGGSPPPTPPLTFDNIDYTAPAPEHSVRDYNEGCFTVNQPWTAPGTTLVDYARDYWGARVVADGFFHTGDIIPVGYSFCFSESGGILSEIVNAISGLIDAVGDVVNYISRLYDEIKDDIVNFAAGVINTFVECNDVCKKYLMAGLDYALASVGLPPSLPNFDELEAQGLDYLKKTAAEESGLPPELVSQAVDIAGQAIDQLRDRNHKVDAVWLTPDDFFRPMRMTLQIHADTTAVTSIPNDLRYAPGLSYDGSDVLLPADSLAAGDNITVPIQFLPNFSSIAPPPPCSGVFCFPLTDGQKQLYYEDQWYAGVAGQSCEGWTGVGYQAGVQPGLPTFYLPLFGTQMQWLGTPSVSASDTTPFRYACP